MTIHRGKYCMKYIITLIILFCVSSVIAQSSYHETFLDKKIKSVSIEAKILDTLKFVKAKGPLIMENYALLELPQTTNFLRGKILEKSTISLEGGIVSIQKITYKYSKNFIEEVTSVNKYPLLENLKILFDQGVMFSDHSDTSYVVYSKGRITEEYGRHIHTYFIYPENSPNLSHKITLSELPVNFSFDKVMLENSLIMSDPYIPNNNGVIKNTALGGVLGQIYFDSVGINLLEREDFLYDNEGKLIGSLLLSPPFVEKRSYLYDSNNLLIEKSIIEYGETGLAGKGVEQYQYDINNYRWPLNDTLIYANGRLKEVRSNRKEMIRNYIEVIGEDNKVVTDEYGDPLYDMEFEEVTYQVTKFIFEYYPDGKLKKEIIPGKVEYFYSYSY